MSFLDKNGLQVLTNKLVQGDAIKVASHRGHTVKNVIDNIQRECENVATPNTMNLENRINEFKVGQGRDLDVSGDVEEGKVEVELKGKTYQNLCESNAKVSIQHMNDYEIEQTSEYLKVKRVAKTNSGWFYYNNSTLKIKMLKPNTTYTLFFKYESTVPRNIRTQFMQGDATNWLSDSAGSQRLSTNIYRTVIKTFPSFEGREINSQVIYFHNCEPREVGETTTIYKDMLLLEGDYSDLSVEELPSYFSGIKSSFEDGVVDVEVQGKNLFDESKHLFNVSIGSNSGVKWGTGKGGNRYSIKIPCEPNTTYSFSKIGGDRFGVWTHDEDFDGNTEVELHYKIKVDDFKESFVFKTNSTAKVICIYVSLYEKAKNIQIEKLGSPTKYEPYYKKKISFNIGESLRSLPNGVCDEIRNNNGQWELVRRVHKVVLDGSEGWKDTSAYEGFSRFSLALDNQSWSSDTPIGVASINDKFINRITESHGGYEYIYIQGSHSNTICFCQLTTEKASSLDTFKKWLSKNPTTIYYELKEPAVTPIESIEFDIKPHASININSETAPVSNHRVILNRAGQIERGITQIAELKKRVDALEVSYDSYLLETQHKLSILGFEYELESEEI